MGRPKVPRIGRVPAKEIILREQSISECEKMFLRGVTNPHDIGRALGVSGVTAEKWVKLIRDRWQKRALEGDHEEFRLERIQRLDNLARLALESYEDSKKPNKIVSTTTEDCGACRGAGYVLEAKTTSDELRQKILNRDGNQCVLCGAEEDLTIDHIIPRSRGGSSMESNLRCLCFPCNRIKSNKLGFGQKCENCDGEGKEEFLPSRFRPCPTCQGSGAKLDVPICGVCRGTGKHTVQTVQIRQQSGDAAYLNAARAAYVEAAKIEGLYPVNHRISKTILTETQTVGGEIHRTATEMFVETELPHETVIRGLALIDELERLQKKNETRKAKKAETLVIETTVIPQEEDSEFQEE